MLISLTLAALFAIVCIVGLFWLAAKNPTQHGIDVDCIGTDSRWVKQGHEYLNVFYHSTLPISLYDWETGPGWTLRYKHKGVKLVRHFPDGVSLETLETNAKELTKAGRAAVSAIKENLA